MVKNALAGSGVTPGFVDDAWAHLASLVPEMQGTLVHTGDAEETLLAPVADGDLQTALTTYTNTYPEADKRALISLWAQRYLQVTWIPLAIGAFGGLSLPAPCAVRLRVDAFGRPIGIAVGAGEHYQERTVEAQLAALTRDHTAPIIDGLADVGGFSPRVAWNAVGAIHAWLVERVSQSDAGLAIAPALHLLADAVLTDGTANPIYTTRRRQAPYGRRVCCLRYRLDGLDYCGDCPIPSAGRRL